MLAAPCGAARRRARPRPPKPAEDFADPAKRRLEQLRVRLEALIETLRPKFNRLQKIRDEYALSPNGKLPGLFEERKALLDGMMPGWDEMLHLEHEFNRQRTALDVAKVATAFKSFLQEKGTGIDASKELMSSQVLMDFGREVRDFQEKGDRIFSTEEAAFRAARKSYENRRFWGMVTGVLGALLLLSLVAVLIIRRRQAQQLQLTGGAGPQPTLSTGPQQALPPPGAAPAEIGPGAVISGNYRIDREIGQGGMGMVYEAMDVTLNRKVAIKRMHEVLAGAGNELELFLSEARLVAQLKHPNIVEIYSILKEAGQIFLVFEFVGGKALSDYIDQSPRISMRSAKGVIRQIGSALDYAHGRKVIHRDLKPQNVMITPEGAAKVMDFGIAHQASMTVAKLTHTQNWGTPPYMAPEQELGKAAREADLFAMGVCFYEMITGNLPFEGPNFLAQKQAKLFTPPSKAAPGIPAAADAVLRRALDPDPAKRYHSAKEFLADVAALPDKA